MTRTAIYARYSCDKQSETSIEDQIRRCRETAQRFGLTVDNDLIFTDAAMSGMEVANNKREGYKKFSQAWISGQFDCFIVDEFGRLSRDAVEQAQIIRRLEQNRRVRMICADGINTAESDWQLRVGLQGILAQQEIRKIQHRVGRGMLGQLERGFMIATPVFGYDLKREFDSVGDRIGTRWVINSTEASVVQEIFSKREAGQSMHQIAAWLNTSGVPCSRAAKKPDGGYWRPSRVRSLLANTVYRGEFVWHGSRNYRLKAEKQGVPMEQKVFARPELRIVSDETWNRCNTKSHSRTGYGGGKHFLAGLITCGCCGGTLVLSAHSRCRSVYCANCTVAKHANNELDRQTSTVATEGVQLLLTRALKHFLTPGFLELFRTALRQRLTGDKKGELDAARSRLAQLRSSQDRLSRLLADVSNDDPVLESRYNEARDKVANMQTRLQELEAGCIEFDEKTVRTQLQVDPAEFLNGLFDADLPPERLRSILARLFPSIVFEGKTGRYMARFRIRFAPGVALALASRTDVLEDGGAELWFKVWYTPLRRGKKGCWSVSAEKRPSKRHIS